jgi:hypothetical protein
MFRQAVQIRDHRLTYVLEQLERDEILAAVAGTRVEHPVADRPGLGRWALSIPMEDMARLRLVYPDLAASDNGIRSKAWMRFIQSDESRPYRMRERI